MGVFYFSPVYIVEAHNNCAYCCMDKTPFSLIAKYLQSETSESENQTLAHWRSEVQANEEEFQRLKDTWLLTYMFDSAIDVKNKNEVWNKISQKIVATPLNNKVYSRSFLFKAVSIAASIALFFGLSLSMWLVNAESASYTTVFANRGQKAEVVLPDGTLVWLNSESKITYPSNFNNQNRSVELVGEAFFDVKKRGSQQFKVFVDKICINVLGTAFNVNAYPNKKNIQVALLRGKVTIRELNTNNVLSTLLPDQKLEILKDQNLTSQLSVCNGEDISLWRHSKLKIENIPMKEVVSKMEHWYGVDINFQNLEKCDNKRYWMTIKTETLTEMLEVVNKITPIKYTINGEEVTVMYR